MTFKTLFSTLLFFFLAGSLSHATTSQEQITMNLPVSIVQSAADKSLPLTFRMDSKALLGTISIDKIEDLKFLKDKLSSHITMSGHDLRIVTSIAGHDLKMKLGNVTMSFQCDATIRFDAAKQILFIRPIITSLKSSNDQATDVASTIALLFNNRELPLQIEKLKPLVANTGNKLLNISMNTNNIELQPDSLLVSISPIINVKKQ